MGNDLDDLVSAHQQTRADAASAAERETSETEAAAGAAMGNFRTAGEYRKAREREAERERLRSLGVRLDG